MSLKETIDELTIGDRIIFIVLITVSLLGIIFIKDVLPDAGNVVIEIEGHTKYRYPIDVDRLVNVKSSRGSLNVEIKDKKVRVIDASCPNKLCERQGWVDRGSIVCLPNRISVIIGGSDEKNKKIDAITG